jgi:hypothetical protein
MEPIVISLDELRKNAREADDGKPLIRYERCTFRSAHFCHGLLAPVLKLNDVMIPDPNKKGGDCKAVITVDTAIINLGSGFATIVHDPTVEGISVELLMVKPIKMRVLGKESQVFGEPMEIEIPPDMITLKGAIIRCHLSEDFLEWDTAVKAKLDTLAEYDMQEELKQFPPVCRPKAPRV